ncbi:MAG TPA: hypothetical protein VFC07_07435, partial [Verrucomicrobiae bacterium]|nr:hypothetical protein [Verrucomicrobiae bacterium]
PPNTNFDDLEFFYGRGSPNDPATCLQHRTTQGQFKRRNAKGGKNHVRAAQLLIVLLYSFWEHEYRPKLAEALGLANPNELRMPLFGEIRELRNDVLHHHGVVTRETVKKLLVFSNVQENKEIILTEITVGLLIGHIKEAIDNLVTDAGLEDPKYRTVWHFQ